MPAPGETQGQTGVAGMPKNKKQLLMGGGVVAAVVIYALMKSKSAGKTSSANTAPSTLTYDSTASDLYGSLESQILGLQQALQQMQGSSTTAPPYPTQPSPLPPPVTAPPAPPVSSQPTTGAATGISTYTPPPNSGQMQVQSGTEQVGNGQSTYLASTSPSGGLTQASPVSLVYDGQQLPGGADYLPGTYVTGESGGNIYVSNPPINPVTGVISGTPPAG